LSKVGGEVRGTGGNFLERFFLARRWWGGHVVLLKNFIERTRGEGPEKRENFIKGRGGCPM